MPTEPLRTVLYSELSKIQATEFLIDVSPLLTELINNGTLVLIRCADSASSDKDVDLAPLSIYKHILEMADAFATLIAAGISTPTIPLLRSMFEALLSLEFVCENKEKYNRRSLQWLSSHVRNKSRVYQTLLIGTDRYKEFKAMIKKDKSIQSWPVFPQDELKKHIVNLEELQKKDHFIEIQDEYKRLEDTGIKNPHWYSLFSGPRSMEELANEMNRPVQYNVLYRQWSKFSHAQDFSNFLQRTPTGKPGIKGMRDAGQLITFSRFAIVFSWEATAQILKHFRASENPNTYYEKEIRPRFVKIMNIDKGTN